MKIGLISDTHGYLDPAVPPLFAGVDRILHAGDIGPASLIVELEQIAPVTAVIGNTDWENSFPETALVELDGWKFLVCHIVDPGRPSEAVRRRLFRDEPDVVVFGHTHKPCEAVVDGVWFINPGYAGKQRFNLPRSVAVLEVDEAGARLRRHEL